MKNRRVTDPHKLLKRTSTKLQKDLKKPQYHESQIKIVRENQIGRFMDFKLI